VDPEHCGSANLPEISIIRTLSGLVPRTGLNPCALFQGAAEARSLAAQTIQYYGGEEGGKKLGHLARFTHHTQGHARQSLVQSRQCSGSVDPYLIGLPDPIRIPKKYLDPYYFIKDLKKLFE
jgi:hypothetical protein